jgi:N-acetylglucosamine-6-phosphate deacetylase
VKIIVNGKIIAPSGILDGHALVIEGARIEKIVHTDTLMMSAAEEIIDARGGFVAAGFIDLHVHGGNGADAMDATLESLAKISQFHASGGSTTIVPTTVTASAEAISKTITAVTEARQHDFGGAQIFGVHIEGPYISLEKIGAQDKNFARNPDKNEYAAWLAQSDGITQMTLAPELDGALELIDALLEHEIIPAAGHSAAMFAETKAAIERGLCQATHLYNCMSSATKIGAERVPGMVETLLADERVMVEIIADGHHVHPELIKLALRAKGIDKICLVTDATAGAGLPDGATFRIGTVDAVVQNGVALTADGAALAGSTSKMMDLVRVMVTKVGVNLHDAVRMASQNPARALGIGAQKGTLEPKKVADIVIFDENFNVTHTLVGGRVVFWAQPTTATAEAT